MNWGIMKFLNSTIQTPNRKPLDVLIDDGYIAVASDNVYYTFKNENPGKKVDAGTFASINFNCSGSIKIIININPGTYHQDYARFSIDGEIFGVYGGLSFSTIEKIVDIDYGKTVDFILEDPAFVEKITVLCDVKKKIFEYDIKF